MIGRGGRTAKALRTVVGALGPVAASASTSSTSTSADAAPAETVRGGRRRPDRPAARHPGRGDGRGAHRRARAAGSRPGTVLRTDPAAAGPLTIADRPGAQRPAAADASTGRRPRAPPRRCATCCSSPTSTPTSGPRTPTSSTTTSWSGCAVRDRRRRARSASSPRCCTCRARTCSSCGAPTAARCWCRSSRDRPRGRPRRPAASWSTRRRACSTEPGTTTASRRAERACASTSSRSSPSTSRRCGSRWSARPSTTGCSTCRARPARLDHTTGTAPSTTPRTAAAPGMVMRPEPWGAALDARARRGDPATSAVVVPDARAAAVHPGAGRTSWPREPWLVFACGRYEGIDQRVLDDAARPGAGQRGLARRLRARRRRGGGAGDRRGGRPAAARRPRQRRVAGRRVARRRAARGPGYTKPPEWRGRDVPEVLLSGDHARIARWRRDEALRRTAARRPDLLAASTRRALDRADLRRAGRAAAGCRRSGRSARLVRSAAACGRLSGCCHRADRRPCHRGARHPAPAPTDTTTTPPHDIRG